MATNPRPIHIGYKGSKGVWLAVQDGTIIDMALTKDELVASVTELAEASDAAVVRIHDESGQLEEERTFGSSADPESSTA